METSNRFTFWGWVGAGNGFGIGFALALMLIGGALLVACGALILRKGADLASAVVERIESDSKTMEPVTGVYLISTNLVMRETSVTVIGSVTNSSGVTLTNLTVYAGLSGGTTGVLVDIQTIEKLEADSEQQVSFIFDGVAEADNPEAMTVSVEFSREPE